MNSKAYLLIASALAFAVVPVAALAAIAFRRGGGEWLQVSLLVVAVALLLASGICLGMGWSTSKVRP